MGNRLAGKKAIATAAGERIGLVFKDVGWTEKAMEIIVARQPMGQLGHEDENAAPLTHLASNDSAFTTGTEKPIDGGWTL